MSERFIVYGDRYMNYEPMIAYHCHEEALRKGVNDQMNQMIQFKMNQLKQGMMNVLNDRQFQNDYLNEFVQRHYITAQQQFQSDKEKSKVTFLLVADLIEMLNDCGMVTQDMINVRTFIINQGFIPNGVRMDQLKQPSQQQFFPQPL